MRSTTYLLRRADRQTDRRADTGHQNNTVQISFPTSKHYLPRPLRGVAGNKYCVLQVSYGQFELAAPVGLSGHCCWTASNITDPPVAPRRSRHCLCSLNTTQTRNSAITNMSRSASHKTMDTWRRYHSRYLRFSRFCIVFCLLSFLTNTTR